VLLCYIHSNVISSSPHIQPNISFVVNVVSRFMQDLKEIHFKDKKRIFHYIKDTYMVGIRYCNHNENQLVSHIDSN
jgi:hypothetical protein